MGSQQAVNTIFGCIMDEAGRTYHPYEPISQMDIVWKHDSEDQERKITLTTDDFENLQKIRLLVPRDFANLKAFAVKTTDGHEDKRFERGKVYEMNTIQFENVEPFKSEEWYGFDFDEKPLSIRKITELGNKKNKFGSKKLKLTRFGRVFLVGKGNNRFRMHDGAERMVSQYLQETFQNDWKHEKWNIPTKGPRDGPGEYTSYEHLPSKAVLYEFSKNSKCRRFVTLEDCESVLGWLKMPFKCESCGWGFIQRW